MAATNYDEFINIQYKYDILYEWSTDDRIFILENSIGHYSYDSMIMI